MKPIIKVQNLSKQYRIGAHQAPYRTLRETLTDAVKSPLKRFSRTRYPEENTIWALKDINFEVFPGEVLGIIGRNGAGKSTLLKVLSRITEPTAGKVDLYGRVGSLLEVGTGFHPELTGRENIFLSAAILGMRRSELEGKFDEIVAFAEIDRLLDTAVKHYSSGMFMRLAFSVAAHLDPEILIIDEVLAVGDVEFQKKCLGRISDISKKGRTVLFVSHNLSAIERLCSTLIVLERGRLKIHSHNIKEVFNSYLNDDTAVRSTEWVNLDDSHENPWFKPIRFYIANENGHKCNLPFQNNSHIWIYIEAEIKHLDPALTIGYAIYTEDGNLLYWSYQTDDIPERWPHLQIGRCILKSRIPERLLNEGEYRIELIGGLHYRQWLFEPLSGTPTIYVTIKGGLSDSPMWLARRAGLLAPVLKWQNG